MFIKDKRIDARNVLKEWQRKEFAQWFICGGRELKKYNHTENLILFLKYHYGLGRRQIAKTLKISEYSVNLFLKQLKICDFFEIPQVRHKYLI